MAFSAVERKSGRFQSVYHASDKRWESKLTVVLVDVGPEDSLAVFEVARILKQSLRVLQRDVVRVEVEDLVKLAFED
jgi:hypothetical protein